MEKVEVKKTMAIVVIKIIALQLFFILCYIAVAYINNSIAQLNNGSLLILAMYRGSVILIIAALQVIFSLYIFLEWVMEKYTILPDKIEHQWGIIFRETDSWQINNVETAFIGEGVIARLCNYGTITFHSPTLEEHIVLRDVPSPSVIVTVVEKNVSILGRSQIKFIKPGAFKNTQKIA